MKVQQWLVNTTTYWMRMGKEEHTIKPGEKRYGKLIAVFKSPRTNVQMSKTGPHMIPII